MIEPAIRKFIIEIMSGINILSQKELRVSKKSIIIDGSVVGIEEEDLRISFIQGIQNLATQLYPYFDEIMEKYYTQNITFLEDFAYEFMEKINDKKFNEKIKNSSEDKKSELLLLYQVKESRKMFLQLNLFLQRTNLLKGDEDGRE